MKSRLQLKWAIRISLAKVPIARELFKDRFVGKSFSLEPFYIKDDGMAPKVFWLFYFACKKAKELLRSESVLARRERRASVHEEGCKDFFTFAPVSNQETLTMNQKDIYIIQNLPRIIAGAGTQIQAGSRLATGKLKPQLDWSAFYHVA